MGMMGYWLIPVIFGIFILGTLGLSQDAFAATDIFLKIVDIEGESVDAVHATEIDVLAWSWGMSSTSTNAAGGGGGVGKPTIQDLSITKFVDSATPKLMESTLLGTSHNDVKLTLRSEGRVPLEFLTIEMTGVFVTSVIVGGSTADDKLTETITLDFATVKVIYTPSLADGSPGSPVEISFEIADVSK